MNAFDHSVLAWMNGFAQRSVAFDTFVLYVSGSDFMKGYVSVATIYGLWFSGGRPKEPRYRATLLAALGSAFLALFVGRILAQSLPFRVRPLHDPRFHFVVPHGLDEHEAAGWSAFPSDHAMLYFALATGVFIASRRAGALLFLHALIIVSLPRMYLGLHHPTDIIGGAILGMCAALVMTRPFIRDPITKPLFGLLDRRPGAFYALLFFVSAQIATMFLGARKLLWLIEGWFGR